MANFFSLQDGNLIDPSVYGYSLSGVEVMNSTTGVWLSTVDAYGPIYIGNGSTISAVAVHLSARVAKPTNSILTLKLSSAASIITETYAVSSFTSYNGSDNLISPYPQNWQILKLTNPYTVANASPFRLSLATSVLSTLSLMGSASNYRYDQALITTTSMPATATLTVGGNPKLSANSPYNPNGWSAYFNGSAHYLQLPNANVGFGTADFTIETWIYPTSRVTTYPTIFSNYNSYTTGQIGIFAGHNSNTTKYSVAVNAVDNVIVSNTTISYNLSWVHLAIVRTSGTFKFFINGIQEGGDYTPATNPTLDGVGSDAAIGASLDSVATTYLNAYISNFRIVKGTALYTSNFTPSTAKLTNVTNTALLTLQDNNIFKDNSNNKISITTSGPPTISAVSPFPSAVPYSLSAFDGSINFDGSSYVKTAANSIFNLNKDFTIDVWVNTLSTTAVATYSRRLLTLNSAGTSSSNNLEIILSDGTNPSSILSLYNSAMLVTGNIPVANGAWHNIAVSRIGSSLRLFVDGVQSGTTATTTQAFDAGVSNGIIIGAFSTTGQGNWNGLISNLRIINGIGLYASNFTPPTLPTNLLLGTSLYFNASAFILSAYKYTPSIGDVHISSALKGLGSEPRIITSDLFTSDNLYIHNQGTLTFPLTSNNTLTLYGSAGLQITSDGTLNIGTSSSSIPLRTTHTIILSNTNIQVHDGGNLNIYGFNKPQYSYLQYDTNAGSNSFASNASLSSYWISGDVLAFTGNLTASTLSADILVLSSFSSDKNFRTTSNSPYAYNSLSSNPYIPTVCNLTRNVILTGSHSSPSYIYSFGNSKVNISNCSFNNIHNGLTVDVASSGYTNLSGNVFNNSVNNNKRQEWGMYFNGSTSITTSYDSGNALGTNQFTMEIWVYPISGGSGYCIVSDFYHQASPDSGWYMTWHSTNYTVTWLGTTTSVNSVLPNKWTHIAYTRDASNNLKCYINGVFNVSAAYASSITGGGDRLRFGNFRLDALVYYWTGYMSNFRLTKGQVLYPNNFTPSTKRFTTTSQGAKPENVAFLLNDNIAKDRSLYANAITINNVTYSSYENPFKYLISTINKSNLINNIYYNYALLSSYGISFNNTIMTNSNVLNNMILYSNGYGLYINSLSASNSIIRNNFVTTSSGIFINNCLGLSSTIGAISFKSNSCGILLSGYNTGNYILSSVYSKKEGVYVDASTSNLSGVTFQNILANNNSSVGFKVSGNNLNYLTPITLNINGLVANNNLDFGFEGYNITGNLSNITSNNNYVNGIKTSIGNGPTVFDGVSSYVTTLNYPVCALSVSTTAPSASTNTPYISGSDISYNFNGGYFSTTDSGIILGSVFTWEAWIYNGSTTASSRYFVRTAVGNGMEIGTDPNSKLYFSINNSGGTIVLSPNAITPNVWTHYAVTRDTSNVIRMYFNGTVVASATNSTNGDNTGVTLYIGANYIGTVANQWYCSTMRVLTGVALYTNNFTPNSTIPILPIANTIFFLKGSVINAYQKASLNPSVSAFNILSAYNYSQTVIKNSFLSATSVDPALSGSIGLVLDSTRFGEFSLDNSTLCAATPLQLNITRNILEGSYLFNNSILGSTPLGTGITSKYQSNVFRNTGFAFTNLNKISAYNVTYLVGGSRMLDYVTPSVQTSDVPTERLTPTSNTIKLCSGSKYVAVNAGDVTSISVYIRTSIVSDGTAYNGNPPRLILRGNPAVGVYSDIILGKLDSSNNVSGSYVLLTANTPVAIDDGVFEFYIDCDGTAGWVNIDNWNAV